MTLMKPFLEPLGTYDPYRARVFVDSLTAGQMRLLDRIVAAAADSVDGLAIPSSVAYPRPAAVDRLASTGLIEVAMFEWGSVHGYRPTNVGRELIANSRGQA